MIILASEDVGLADPHAVEVVISCAEAFDRIGFPEGNFPLAQACLYLATAPKSNSAMAFFDALKEVDREDAEVPNNLRDGSRDAEGFGHGEGYIYPHAYRDHWAAQQYLPTALLGRTFYIPSIVGYEGRIRDEVLRRREIQAAVILGDAAKSGEAGSAAAEGEALSWSAAAKGREGWFKRLESGRSALLLADRDLILNQNKISRHHRVLVTAANDGLLLWECLRRCPEGLAAALTDMDSARDALLRFAEIASPALDETEKPLVAVFPNGKIPSPEEAEDAFGCSVFDHIFSREPWRRIQGKAPAECFSAFAVQVRQLLAPGGKLVMLQSPPGLGERISRILRSDCAANNNETYIQHELIEELAVAEDAFFSEASGNERWTWDAATLEKAFLEQDLQTEIKTVEREEERLLASRDLDVWFDAESSPWGSFISGRIGAESFDLVRRFLDARISKGPLLWKWRSLLLNAKLNS